MSRPADNQVTQHVRTSPLSDFVSSLLSVSQDKATYDDKDSDSTVCMYTLCREPSTMSCKSAS